VRPPVLALRTISALTHYIDEFVLQERTERQEGAATPADQLAALAEQLDGGIPATLRPVRTIAGRSRIPSNVLYGRMVWEGG
jgi:hypothetical protein